MLSNSLSQLNSSERSLENVDRPIPAIGLLHCYDLIDDFLDSIDLSFEEFCEKFIGSWMFGYIQALDQAGVRTVLFCISARVTEVRRYLHQPTGATLCVLPASSAYRRYRSLRNRLLRSYGGGEGQAFKDIADVNATRRSLLTTVKDLIKSAGTYLSTPLDLLAQELEREKCQAILCQEYEFARFDACVWLGRRIDLPVFASFQGGTQTQSGLELPFRHLAFRHCRGVIVATQSEIERIRHRYSLPDRKIARIFNPIDLTNWQPGDRAAARALLNIPEQARVVVWHGRVEIERKGLDLLLDAWEQVCRDRPDQELRLLLVGTGSDAEKLQQRISERPNAERRSNIIWIDEFINDRNRIQQYLAAANLYVMSSRQEGFPVAPLEAMACGLPVVATDAPGIPDILQQGEQSGGLMVPRNDTVALAAAIGRVIDDLDWARELGQQARSRVETHFSSPAVGQQLRDFLLPHSQANPAPANPASPNAMPKVTVVIPAYNAMDYLPQTLNSVLKQTFVDFEVLIINDGSRDHLEAWAAEIADARVRVITQNNQGLPAARNTGIRHAQGDYIAFLDADDCWEATKLEKQVNCLDAKPEVGLVYTWTLLVDQQGKSTGTVTAAEAEGKVWEKLLLGDVVGSGSSAMIRRSCFSAVGLFDTELTSIEDCDMWVRIAAHYPFAVIKEVLVYYRQHPSNMSRDYDRMMHNSRLKIEKKFKDVPFELLYLRPRAYGHAFLWLAWKVMFDGGAPEKAAHFAQQAVLHYPQMRYSAKYLRLRLALLIVRGLGADRYSQLKNLKYKLRGGVFQYHQ